MICRQKQNISKNIKCIVRSVLLPERFSHINDLAPSAPFRDSPELPPLLVSCDSKSFIGMFAMNCNTKEIICQYLFIKKYEKHLNLTITVFCDKLIVIKNISRCGEHMIKVILWDIDGTVLDFKAAEKAAIKGLFEEFSIGTCTDEMIERYSLINDKYWKKLERGELTKPEVLTLRFVEFFEKEGIAFDKVDEFNSTYQLRLGDTICFNDNAYELIETLKGKVLQYAVTNGTQRAQKRKLERSNLNKLFDGIFISDEIGVEKPNKEFFDIVFSKIPNAGRDEVIIVGDSLTSDIKGANNAGIKSVWYNPKGKENNIGVNIDYTIKNLGEIKDIIYKEGN